MRVKERWFLEDVSPWDSTSTHGVIDLSNYRLPSLEKLAAKKISSLREVFLVDAIVKPGKASGEAIIDGKIFQLTYAWGGINSKEDYHRRESYSVQIKRSNCGRFLFNLAKRINKAEGKRNLGIWLHLRLHLPFVTRVKPYKI